MAFKNEILYIKAQAIIGYCCVQATQKIRVCRVFPAMFDVITYVECETSGHL